MMLNKTLIALSAAKLLVVAMVFGPSAWAAVSIGTVDLQNALQSVNRGKSARSKLEKEFNKKKAELQKEEAEIKKMHEEFQKQSLVMSDKARVAKQSELQERIMKFQEKTARSQMEIQQREQQLTEPILKDLRGIITDLAKEKKYTVVLEKSQNNVLYSLEKDDLTQQVIEKYNKKKK